MGKIYSNYSWSSEQIGTYENGYIYKGWGVGKIHIGNYSNGTVTGAGIFSATYGSYENGNIYRGFGFSRQQIGCCKNGTIYKGWGMFSDPIGRYDGDLDGACAAVILLFDFN